MFFYQLVLGFFVPNQKHMKHIEFRKKVEITGISNVYGMKLEKCSLLAANFN